MTLTANQKRGINLLKEKILEGEPFKATCVFDGKFFDITDDDGIEIEAIDDCEYGHKCAGCTHLVCYLNEDSAEHCQQDCTECVYADCDCGSFKIV